MNPLEQAQLVQTPIPGRLELAFATFAHLNQHRAVTLKAYTRAGELPSRAIRFQALTKALLVMLALPLLPVRSCRIASRLRRLR